MDDLDALRRDDELLDALGARVALPARAGGAADGSDELAALLGEWAREIDRETAAALERGFTPTAPSWLLTGSSVGPTGSASRADTGALAAVDHDTQILPPSPLTPPTSLDSARRRSSARHGRRERHRPFAGVALATAALLMVGTGGAAAAAGQGDPLHGLRVIGSAVAGLISGSSEEGRAVPTASGRGGTTGEVYRAPRSPGAEAPVQAPTAGAGSAMPGSMGVARDPASSRPSPDTATRRPTRKASGTAPARPEPGASRPRVTAPPASAPAPVPPTATSATPGSTAPTAVPSAPAPSATAPSATGPVPTAPAPTVPTAPAPTVPAPPPATTAPPSPSPTCTHTDNGNNKNQKCKNRDRRGPKALTGPLTTVPQPVAPPAPSVAPAPGGEGVQMPPVPVTGRPEAVPPLSLLACTHAGISGQLGVDCPRALYPRGVQGWTVDLALPWVNAR